MGKKAAAAMAALGFGIFLVIVSGTLRAKAKGEEDFRIEGTTLTAYLGTDTFVSIPDTVRTIGESAFAENTTLQSVEFPEGLQEIGYNAFGDCTALTSITIPDSVTKVGPGAFKGCTALTLAELGSGIRSWGSGVFNDCTSLDKLILDEDNSYLTYYNGAIYNGDMSMLYQVIGGRTGENYVMPDEVEQIDTYAFWNLQNTKNVKVSPNVTTIPAYSMSSMGSVENVILPDSVTTISEKAFANNTSLKQVMIPASVSNIHSTAFANSPNVSILTVKNSTAEQYGQNKKIPVIYDALLPVDFNDSNESGQIKPTKKYTVMTVGSDEDVQEDSENAEEQVSSSSSDENPLDTKENGIVGKTRIVNGKAVVLIGKSEQKVYGTNSAESEKEVQAQKETEEPKENEALKSDNKEGESVNSDSKETEKQQENVKDTSSQDKNQTTQQVKKETDKNELIEQKAYYKQKSLTNYTFSEKIKEIGRLSFAQSGLKSIEIPKGVKTIEYGAFYDCENLEKVTIPDSVTSIGTKAFADTPWLDGWLKCTSKGGEDDFLIVGDGILLAYRGKAAKVEIPSNVKQIGSEVFKGHNELTEVTLPESVFKIGADAFRNCSKLTTVNGCKGLRTIVRGAFYGTKVSEEKLTSS